MEEFYPKVVRGASEVISLRDEEDTLFLPHFVILYVSTCSPINRSALALGLPLSPPSGWKIQLRNRDTAAHPSLQSIACFCFCLSSLPPSTSDISWTWNIQHIFSAVALTCHVPCVLQRIRGTENVVDCRELIFDQIRFFSHLRLWCNDCKQTQRNESTAPSLIPDASGCQCRCGDQSFH